MTDTIKSLCKEILKEFSDIRKLHSPEYEKQYRERITPKIFKLMDLLEKIDGFKIYIAWAWERPIMDVRMDERVTEFKKYLAIIGGSETKESILPFK